MLIIKNIEKTFHKGTVNEKIVMDGMSLHLKKGDFVTIIGSNGAGKSTLLNLVSGSLSIDRGEIYLDGENISEQKEFQRANKIGRLFQDPLKGTAPNMTIEENLALACARGGKQGLSFAIKGKDYRLFREKIAALNLGLEDRLKTKMGMLSGGQRQAITLLMATIITPKLLLLDEHTAALDPITAEKVLHITEEIIRHNKITTMMITHHMQSALAVGNRTVMMDNGKIVLDMDTTMRKTMTVEDMIQQFKMKTKENTPSDKMILS